MITDDLFELIKALTPTEKRYFKIHAKTHVGDKYKNNYEKLFDAINYWPDDMPYDEKVFKRKHKGKTFIKNLSVEKNYLYELLLETMRRYQAENKQEIRLHQLTADLNLLYNKGLLDQARKLIDKAYAMAEENELIPLMINLCQYNDKFDQYIQPTEHSGQPLKSFEFEKKLLAALEAERNIAHIRREVYYLYTNGKLTNYITDIKTKLEKWNKATTDTNLTTTAQRYYATCNAFIAEKEGNYQSAMQWYEKLLPLAEKHINKNNEPAEYVRRLLSNYLVCAHFCERYDLFNGIIAKIEELPANSPREKAEVFIYTYQYRLLYHINVPQSNFNKKLVTEIEIGLTLHNKLIPLKAIINLRMNICILYLQYGYYDQLISGINTIYELTGRDKKYNQLLRDLKFMEILALCSLQNTDLLNYQVRNTERWLLTNQINNTYTNQLLAATKKWLKLGSPDIKPVLQAITNNQPETAMLSELVKQWK